MSVLRFAGHSLAMGLGLLTASLGCSDPVSPTPQGAFNVTFGNVSGSGITCPATQPTAQLIVGTVGPGQFATEIDGENGATITCRVAKSNAGFIVSGKVLKGTQQFYLASVGVGEGMDNAGPAVSVAGPNTGGKFYSPEGDATCTFTVIEAAEGRAWLAFECPDMSTGSAVNERCSLYQGYVVFENCES